MTGFADAAVEEHPIFVPLDESLKATLLEQGRSDLIEQHETTRRMVIAASGFDPLRYGVEPDIWDKADEQLRLLREKFPRGVLHLVNLGGNRASKTVRAAKRVMQKMIRKPGARVWCLQSTESASQADQQPLIFSMIPPEWRPDSGRYKPRGDRSTKIIYSDSGGFTKGTFILPNGSQCWFKYYGANVKTLEGAEIDEAWADELITPDWIEALRFRLVNRNGILTLTFTPAEHYSDTIKMYLQGSTTLEETEAELLPLFDPNGKQIGNEKVPRVQQSGIPQARIVYFHTSDNPFGNYEGMKMEQAGQSRERILMRVYGVPTEVHGAQFGFVPSVHRITRAQFQEIEKKYPKATRYLVVDPCSGRNWFMGWALCPFPGKVIWYREWPSPGKYVEGIGDPGPWAVFGGTTIRREGGKAPLDGDAGPAQQPFRFGLKRYLEEIEKCETSLGPDGKPKRENIFERWIDSRYGNSAVTDREGQTTLIQQLDDLGTVFCAMLAEARILNVSDGSIDMINSMMDYDKTKPMGEFSEKLGRINEPMMMITEDCPNMEFSLTNWTGLMGCTVPARTLLTSSADSYCLDSDTLARKCLRLAAVQSATNNATKIVSETGRSAPGRGGRRD